MVARFRRRRRFSKSRVSRSVTGSDLDFYVRELEMEVEGIEVRDCEAGL